MKKRRVTSPHGIREPLEGSDSHRVWLVADMAKKEGCSRRSVIAICVEEGIHRKTAENQYSRWQMYRKWENNND